MPKLTLDLSGTAYDMLRRALLEARNQRQAEVERVELTDAGPERVQQLKTVGSERLELDNLIAAVNR